MTNRATQIAFVCALVAGSAAAGTRGEPTCKPNRSQAAVIQAETAERTAMDRSSAPVASISGGRDLPVGLSCAMSYTMQQVAYVWFDTSDGLPYPDMRHNDLDEFDMPFPFNYYGLRADSFAIADDGWLSFFEYENGNVDATHDPLPDPSTPYGVIAPFWADLDPEGGFTVPDQRLLWLKTFGSAPNRVFVITYERFPRLDDDSTEYTFQVQLFENTHVIRFAYKEMDGDQRDRAIGIENEDGTEGFTFVRGENRNMERKAVEFRPQPTSFNCAAATPLTCGARLVNEPMGATDTLVQYGCDGALFRANERVYALTLDQVTLVDLQITPNNPGQNLQAALMTSCDLCNCQEMDPQQVRTVLGPGTYYVAIDGPLAADTGPFDLSLDCESLLGPPSGQTMTVSTGGCDLDLRLDPFANSGGIWSRDGWTETYNDRSYQALRVDGTTYWSTSTSESSCTEFSQKIQWADDNTDKAIIYLRSPEADVIQTVLGRERSGCCGAVVQTRVINRDTVPHYFEFRTLYGLDFGPPVPVNCATLDRVETGPIHVDPNPLNFTEEQNLTCDGSATPPGLCATDCNTPVEFISADDLMTKLIVQSSGDPSPTRVQAEWVNFFDVNRICDPVTPEPWVGGMLPTPDPNSDCGERSGLLYAWRIPAGTGTLAPGEEGRVTLQFGDACKLDAACLNCSAFADLVSDHTELCAGSTATLEASGSEILECTSQGGTVTYNWTRDGAPLPTTGPTHVANEPAPGAHDYQVRVSCEPPPLGQICADSRAITVTAFDCPACSINAVATADTNMACVGEEVIVGSFLSSINACPGTLSYSWTRNGMPIAGAQSSLLVVQEPVGGTYDYAVTISCDPPPIGLSCSSTSASVQITFNEGSTAMPPDLGNTLYAVKVLNDVQLTWTPAPLGEVDTYDLMRGTSKLDLPLPGPPVIESGIVPPMATDLGVVSVSEDYLYRVRGVSCGAIGPY